MKTKATRADAARIIQTARRDGWNCESSVMRGATGRVWNTQVSLTKTVYYLSGNLCYHSNYHIIVSLSKRLSTGRWSVSLVVPNGRKQFRGLWHAEYGLRNVRETVARLAAQKSNQ